MDSVYTTTITKAAKKREIEVRILDPLLPIFELSFAGRQVRCYNGLTDRTGAASFHLAQDKGAANRFLKDRGFHVPEQTIFTTIDAASIFLEKQEEIVVKPISQWGGRGVSTHIVDLQELQKAIAYAQQYSDEIVLEECVSGTDWRLIYVDYQFITAIQRDPAAVTGDGERSIRQLIEARNELAARSDPSNRIPFDKETVRCLRAQNRSYETIPGQAEQVQVRRTSNYHTGGSVAIVADIIPDDIRQLGERIARLLQIPVIGIDILYNGDGHHHIIELSPDLAISPPEGSIVAEAFLDMLFPETQAKSHLSHYTAHQENSLDKEKRLAKQATV